MSSGLGRRRHARGSVAEDDAATRVAPLEQLLAHHIGPLAKVVYSRASKRASDQDELVSILAEHIDAEPERATFLAAAARVLRSLPKTAPAQETPAGSPDKTAEASPPLSQPTEPIADAPREPTSDAAIPARAPRAPAEEVGAMKAGAIFVSYTRQNLTIAQRITDGLRAAGLEVWLDLGKLQPGDAWDLKIRRNIEGCSFFVPLVSRETEARQEGYFRREWNLAADRAMNFADDVPFILPVTIDDTAAYTARVPERFRRAHWISLPDGQVTPELIDYLTHLVASVRSSA